MECKIEFSGGFSARGVIERNGKDFTLSYRLEGDSCTLEYKDGKIVQTRKGDTSLKMEFIKGENSLCIVGDGGLTGTIPISCNDITVVGENPIKVFLDYDLGGEPKKLTISICLSGE